MRKSNVATVCVMLCLLGQMIIGCTKNDTLFYEDGEDNGLAIFSNTGNNVMSCFINGSAWRSRDRSTPLIIGRIQYEVDIRKYGRSNGLRDTFLIDWNGYFSADRQDISNVTLLLSIPRNSGYRYLSGLQGQRLTIDSSNGHFSARNAVPNSTYRNGTGNIYFHTCRFDSIGPNNYTGKISGLFTADFVTFKITRGRFDHSLTEQQINFY